MEFFFKMAKIDRRSHTCRTYNYDCRIKTRGKRNNGQCDYELHFIKILIYVSYCMKRIFLSISLFLVSVVFIIIGVARGEVAVVLQKAVRICMECIGLG